MLKANRPPALRLQNVVDPFRGCTQLADDRESYRRRQVRLRLEAKEKKDKGLEILTKKCMVSLYGRFGIKLDDDIIDLYEYKEIEKINNIKNIQEFNEYVLVRHTPDQQNISLNNKILKPRID